jgi:hypothetical protein
MADSPALCPECQVWPVTVQDAYCGLCGNQIGKLQMSLDVDTVEPGDYKTLVAGVRNPTCAATEIIKVEITEYDDSRQSCAWAQTDLKTPKRLQPGELCEFEILCDVGISGNHAAQIRLHAPWGYDGNGGVILCRDGTPKLTVAPAQVESWLGGPTEFKARIAPQDSLLRVYGVTTDAESWLLVDPRDDLPAGGVLVSRDSPLEVSLLLNEDRFAREFEGRTFRDASRLTVSYSGPDGEAKVEAGIHLQALQQPEVRCLDEGDQRKEFYQVDECGITLRFRNGDPGSRGKSRGPYRIFDIRKSEDADWDLEFGYEQKQVLPVQVMGGQRQQVSFLLDLRRLAPGDHDLAFLVDTDAPEREIKVTVPIHVKPLEHFRGKLVIDFGTTNSCAALVPEGTFQPQMQAIDHKEPLTTSATALLYQSMQRDPPRVQTGNEVKALSSRRVLGHLKQRLGEIGSFAQVLARDSDRWVFREVWRIAADYLREIRRKLERTYRFTDFVLTHPAICSLAQLRNMKLALKEAFPGDVEIQFLQEPLAALVPFFYEQGVAFHASSGAGKQDYTVAAFDIGGGTTDVTLVEVRHVMRGQLAVIHPSIVASWGVKFGGERLTDFVREQVERRCSALLKAPSQEFISVTDAQEQDAAEQNLARIRRWAED